MFVEDGTTLGLNKVIAFSPQGADRDYIQKSNIKSIGGIFSASPGATYKYPILTRVTINMIDGSSFDFEAQDVQNQITWNTGTQTGLNQALSDLNGWL